MYLDNQHRWQHSHSFGQEKRQPGEFRAIIVIGVTAIMMVLEISTGIAFGSMALLADGLHMASHTAALSITAFAYVYARRHAHDLRYSFGTGKVNSLGGFTGAVLLAVFSLVMAWESVSRLIHPVDIAFNQAILVAVVGLFVNGISALILGHNHEHGHAIELEHQDQGGNHCDDGLHQHNGRHGADHHHDHNLRAAYLHVLADALTSLLAIIALLAGKYFALIWMDPLMGIVGAAVVTRWSLGLLHTTSAVLLDRQGPEHLRTAIRESIENDGEDRVVDLHVWLIGSGIYAVELTVVTHHPKPPEEYKTSLPKQSGIAHVTVEVHRFVDEGETEQMSLLSQAKSSGGTISPPSDRQS